MYHAAENPQSGRLSSERLGWRLPLKLAVVPRRATYFRKYVVPEHDCAERCGTTAKARLIMTSRVPAGEAALGAHSVFLRRLV